VKRLKPVGRFLLVLLVGVVGLATLFASTPPPDSIYVNTFNNPFGGEYSDNGTPETSEDDYVAVYACTNDAAKVEVEVFLYNDVKGTLTATPPGNTQPELDQKVVSSSSSRSTVFDITVLGEVKIGLTSSKGGGSVLIKLIPEDVCTGFPLSLIADFAGTLQQTLPEATTLERTLVLRWSKSNLVASLGADAICQRFPDEDKLLCLAGDEANPRLQLEGQIVGDTFTGTYKGFDESTATKVTFEGTFTFKKVR
jgi:hypothetical protein